MITNALPPFFWFTVCITQRCWQRDVLVGCGVRAQGVALIATSPVRHELPPNMLPTPVEVHKYSAPWNDFCDPTSPDMDDVPSPAPPGGGLHCGGTFPLSLLADHQASIAATTLAAQQLTGLSSSDSFADSFDDDTVVSFDDLSEVVSSSTGQRYVASAPPPITDSHAHHSAAEFSALEGPF